MTADSLQIYNPFKCTNGVYIEIKNIFHSSPFIIENSFVFAHNIYYILANLSLANKQIRPRFSNKTTDLIHVQYLCKMSNGHLNVHWTFLFVHWTNGHLNVHWTFLFVQWTNGHLNVQWTFLFVHWSNGHMNVQWTFLFVQWSNGHWCMSNGHY